jgi:hypothetical protein
MSTPAGKRLSLTILFFFLFFLVKLLNFCSPTGWVELDAHSGNKAIGTEFTQHLNCSTCANTSSEAGP